MVRHRAAPRSATVELPAVPDLAYRVTAQARARSGRPRRIRPGYPGSNTSRYSQELPPGSDWRSALGRPASVPRAAPRPAASECPRARGRNPMRSSAPANHRPSREGAIGHARPAAANAVQGEAATSPAAAEPRGPPPSTDPDRAIRPPGRATARNPGDAEGLPDRTATAPEGPPATVRPSAGWRQEAQGSRELARVRLEPLSALLGGEVGARVRRHNFGWARRQPCNQIQFPGQPCGQ